MHDGAFFTAYPSCASAIENPVIFGDGAPAESALSTYKFEVEKGAIPQDATIIPRIARGMAFQRD